MDVFSAWRPSALTRYGQNALATSDLGAVLACEDPGVGDVLDTDVVHENRRVPGLRREEVALLAGVSVDFYTRLERGNVAGVSETVVEALARALQLDDVERAHLFGLVRAAQTLAPRQRQRRRQRIRPSVEHMLNAMPGVPAFVRNRRLDILAANPLGRAFYSQHFDSPYQPVNSARFVFLDPRADDFYGDWNSVARDIVAVLRRRRHLHLRVTGTHRRSRPDHVRLTPPNPARSPSKHCSCSPAGQPHPTRRPPMQITRNSLDTQPGPIDWFTGAVYIDSVAVPSGSSRLSASSVHFTPGARTAWHTHPHGQTIYVLEGVGVCQYRGGPIELIRPGDRVFFEPGEEHWHGAHPNRLMTHLAMQQADDEGNFVTWGTHVTDEEYTTAPPID